MSENDIEIWFHLNADEPLAEMQDFSNKVDEIGSRWQRVKMTIQTETRKVLYSLQGVVSLVRNVFELFGWSLGPVGEALLTVVGSVISSVIAIQYAYAAGGPIGWAMITVSAIALEFSIMAQIKAAMGMEEAKRDIMKVNAVIGSLQNIFNVRRWG